MIDLHSHILPGVDDGSRNFEDSLAILRGLEKQGITRVVLTPHYVTETNYNSSFVKNQKIFAELQKKVKAEKIKIKLHLANEIYIDPEIRKLIRTKKISGINGTKNLLIELPMSGEFEGYEDIFLSLQRAGYTVVLAHPERYRAMHKAYKIIGRLQSQGILMQCNLGSLVGQYGKHAKRTVKKMLKDDLVYCFGTDIHHERDYNEIAVARKKLIKLTDEKKKNKLLYTNTKKLLGLKPSRKKLQK